MATIAATVEKLGRIQGEVIVYTWTPMASGDVGSIVAPEHMHMADRTFQAYGTWDGGVVSLKGTLETSTFAQGAILTDPQGNAITLNGTPVDRVESVTEVVAQLRPEASAGGASMSVTAKLFLRKTLR